MRLSMICRLMDQLLSGSGNDRMETEPNHFNISRNGTLKSMHSVFMLAALGWMKMTNYNEVTSCKIFLIARKLIVWVHHCKSQCL